MSNSRQDNKTIKSENFLIRGTDYLAHNPDFKTVGRDRDRIEAGSILMRHSANSLILAGPGGVGKNDLCLGLQDWKNQDDCPVPLSVKHYKWLDADALFSSGDYKTIHEDFKNTLAVLAKSPDSVLVIEDTRDFIEASRSNGCSHLINALMDGVEKNKFQVIMQVRPEDADFVFKSHSDILELCTTFEVKEPKDGALKDIIRQAKLGLEKSHGIQISDEAVAAAIEVTNKYHAPDLSLMRAQPERSITLLDRSLVSLLIETDLNPKEGQDKREELRASARKFRDTQMQADEMIENYENQITAIKDRIALQKATAESLADDEMPSLQTQESDNASKMLDEANFETDEIVAIRKKIKQVRETANEVREKYETQAREALQGLELKRSHVLTEFSRLSGIPATDLDADQKDKLRNLNANLKKRVYSQDDVVDNVANAIKVSRLRKKKSDKPTAFMFMGASGTGKTELCKAMAEQLQGSEDKLIRFDMSEYQQEHMVSKLIGAPPGYEGFEKGAGALIKAIKANPNGVFLFDEIEKAHKDIFLIFLQILDAGRVTDNDGNVLDCSGMTIAFTSNFGQEHFLNADISLEEQKNIALQELGQFMPPELLNRFNGRRNIFGFNLLDLPTVGKIFKREIGKVNENYIDDGLQVSISDESIQAFCNDFYDPKEGARGIVGYINTIIESAIGNTILESDEKGIMPVTYDPANKELRVGAPVAPTAKNDNDKQPTATTTARFNNNGFKPS